MGINSYGRCNGITEITVPQLNTIPAAKAMKEANYLARIRLLSGCPGRRQKKSRHSITNPEVTGKYGFSGKIIKIKENKPELPEGDYDQS